MSKLRDIYPMVKREVIIIIVSGVVALGLLIFAQNYTFPDDISFIITIFLTLLGFGICGTGTLLLTVITLTEKLKKRKSSEEFKGYQKSFQE